MMVMMIIGLTRYSFQYHVAHREVLISVSVANNNNNITILLTVIWKQAASPPLVADLLIAAAHNCSTVFARWS